MHSCWTSGDAPQDIAWGFDMSVENEARPQGPSKVSRRNLIAGAAVAVPAAAVLNASSAWAKPVVNSLIGMPALVASKNDYQFNDFFDFSAGPGHLNAPDKTMTVSVTLTNSSGETLSGTVTPTMGTHTASPTTIGFGLASGQSTTVTLTIVRSSGKFNPGSAYSLMLAVTATGSGVTKSAPPQGFDITATKP